jgi:hypothetical protein
MNTIVWLVTYVTLLHPDTYSEKRTVCTELVEGPMDIKMAETRAFKIGVPEAFEKEPEGEWVTMDGFRAFRYNDNHSELEDGAIFWIDFMRIVEPADVAVMMKYLAFPSPEVRTQRYAQQLLLRGDHPQ